MSTKRKIRSKIEYYANKIRKLEKDEEQARTRWRRLAFESSSSSSDSEKTTDPLNNANDDEVEINDGVSTVLEPKNNTPDSNDATIELPREPDLDPEILLALGEGSEETQQFGESIHTSLSQRWLPILKKGLNKDIKEKLVKEFSIPENCKLLQAPKLNPEIAAAISDISRNRDKKIETSQQQLGYGITAINRAMSILLTSDEKLKAVKLLGEGCRILCDLHYTETQTRIKIITPGLEKSFLSLVEDMDRDDTLFGNTLSEKIKALKSIEKQGLQIKKPLPTKVNASLPSTSTSRQVPYQENWNVPSRLLSKRGGRGGQTRRTTSAYRRSNVNQQQQKISLVQNKMRVATRK